MKKLLIATTLILSNLGHADEVVKTYLLPNQEFKYRALEDAELGEPIVTWATNYFIPEYQNGSGDIAIRDMAGNELGPKLSLKEWCISALEGSVKITFEDGSSSVYNYQGNEESNLVDCSTILPFDLSKTKFRKSKTIFGEGINNYLLAPYRTIATDQTKIPLGTVLYIPEARGNKIQVGDKTIIHDGYFFVGDRGGAIKDNHIDVFTGINHYASFFPWIGHKAEVQFKAYVVKDPAIIQELTSLHQKK